MPARDKYSNDFNFLFKAFEFLLTIFGYLNNCFYFHFSRPPFTCTKSAMKAPAHCVKPFKINNIINFEQFDTDCSGLPIVHFEQVNAGKRDQNNSKRQLFRNLRKITAMLKFRYLRIFVSNCSYAFMQSLFWLSQNYQTCIFLKLCGGLYLTKKLFCSC